MKIVVVGGTGFIGSKLVNQFRKHGHKAVAAAPSTGGNTITGEGLAEVLIDASAVVDASNAPDREDTAVLKFFETSTCNILASEATARVRHHVALSVAGTERMLMSGYIRAKFAQENLIKASSVPYSILRRLSFTNRLRISLILPRTTTTCICHLCSFSRWRPAMSLAW